MKRIFLGGTCNESTWRESLISKLDSKKLSWFNPVVDDWTEDDMKKELEERASCDLCLYDYTKNERCIFNSRSS